jgi:hypothetical protein
MIRASLRIAMAAALVGIGWAVGAAQNSQPDFELLINAPSGETRIECVRGCTLSWVERGLNSNAEANSRFTYGCGGDRCSSGRVGGWINKP